MPKLSVSIPNDQYDFLKEIDPSPSKAIQWLIVNAIAAQGYIYVPGHWEKK